MTEREINQSVKLLPKRWRGPAILIIALLVAGISFWSAQQAKNQPPSPKVDGSIVKVIDGDTVQVVVSGQTKTVRMIGVDTPEVVDPRKPVQCFGKEASKQSHALLDNQVVSLQSDPTQDDTDKYGRLLRYVYLSDGTLVNLKLIQTGYAHEYTYDIPYQKQDQFKQAQQQAEQQQLGLWSPDTCNGNTSG